VAFAEPQSVSSVARMQPASSAIRFSASREWFPEHCYEVLARRSANGGLTVTLITTGPVEARAWIETFAQADPDDCAQAMREWLLLRALEVGARDDRVLDWAFRISERIAVPVAPI
jgi:hypothetical protein